MATLYVVATPIGNLEDLSPRAARVLALAPVVAAESLNRTRKLLTHLGLRGKRLVSCREANRQRAAQEVLQYLGQGLDVALVTDSGTPGVSDPGALVVSAAAAAGHRLSPIPGPSALAAGLSVAGVEAAPVLFLGFPPAKPGPRRRLFEKAAATGWPFVLYEAPHRLAETAQDLLAVAGDRPVTLARELSKVNEEVAHTTCAALAQSAQAGETKGEVTLVVAGGQVAPAQVVQDDQVALLLRQGLAAGDQPPSRLAKQVAAATGLGREEVYQRLLKLKQEPGAPGLPAPPWAGQQQDDHSEPAALPVEVAHEDHKISRELRVNNSLGLHARVAARIAQTVQGFDCGVLITKDGLSADGSSVLSILTLDAPKGSLLTVETSGPQARAAMASLEELFAADFGEH